MVSGASLIIRGRPDPLRFGCRSAAKWVAAAAALLLRPRLVRVRICRWGLLPVRRIRHRHVDDRVALVLRLVIAASAVIIIVAAPRIWRTAGRQRIVARADCRRSPGTRYDPCSDAPWIVVVAVPAAAPVVVDIDVVAIADVVVASAWPVSGLTRTTWTTGPADTADASWLPDAANAADASWLPGTTDAADTARTTRSANAADTANSSWATGSADAANSAWPTGSADTTDTAYPTGSSCARATNR